MKLLKLRRLKMAKYKYYRVTATSMSSYELYMKVPESITEDDIHAQRNDEILAGERYVGVGRDKWGNVPGDWELSDIIEVDEEDAKEWSEKQEWNSIDEWEEEDFK